MRGGAPPGRGSSSDQGTTSRCIAHPGAHWPSRVLSTAYLPTYEQAQIWPPQARNIRDVAGHAPAGASPRVTPRTGCSRMPGGRGARRALEAPTRLPKPPQWSQLSAHSPQEVRNSPTSTNTYQQCFRRSTREPPKESKVATRRGHSPAYRPARPPRRRACASLAPATSMRWAPGAIRGRGRSGRAAGAAAAQCPAPAPAVRTDRGCPAGAGQPSPRRTRRRRAVGPVRS